MRFLAQILFVFVLYEYFYNTKEILFKLPFKLHGPVTRVSDTSVSAVKGGGKGGLLLPPSCHLLQRSRIIRQRQRTVRSADTECCVRSMSPILSPKLTQASSPFNPRSFQAPWLQSPFRIPRLKLASTVDKTAVPTSGGTVPLRLQTDPALEKRSGAVAGSVHPHPSCGQPGERVAPPGAQER